MQILKWYGGVLGALLWTAPLAGQSAQPLSIQLSGLYASLSGQAYDGIKAGSGFEAQLRYTPSAFSLGGGFQFTSHSLPGFDDGAGTNMSATSIHLYGAFLEPRYVLPVPSNSFAPYLSARLSYLRYTGSGDWRFTDGSNNGTFAGSTGGLTMNGGGGLLVRLSPHVNLDIGATYGYTSFGNFSWTLTETTGGQTIPGDGGPAGSGSNIVVRVGLAMGIGS
jgi:hypothetical protein